MATFCSKDAGSRDRWCAQNRDCIRHTGSNWERESLSGKWGARLHFGPWVQPLPRLLYSSTLISLGRLCILTRSSLVEVVPVPCNLESIESSAAHLTEAFISVTALQDKQQSPRVTASRDPVIEANAIT